MLSCLRLPLRRHIVYVMSYNLTVQLARTLYDDLAQVHLVGLGYVTAPAAGQLLGLVIRLGGGTVRFGVVCETRILRVRLGAFRDGHHGVLGPDMDGLFPVEAVYAASLDRDYVFGLAENREMSLSRNTYT
jgi:hypothetical protein